MDRNFFKIGDVVKLKGHVINPRMTISYTPNESVIEKYVGCLWFDGAELNNGTFHQDTLNLIKGD